jgi:uncharacterized protein YgbK (DUF1537 family)
MVMGVIADDYTGGTDVAAAFRRKGLRTLLFFGLPDVEEQQLPPYDVLVVALKTRMAPPHVAAELSLAALAWLRERGASSFYFKFCSTFDSTAKGNIGPVLDALSSALAVETVVLTPSSPQHGRTQYRGLLFVGDRLLSESHMRDHPVTPMTDSHVARLLRPQTSASVAVLDLEDVAKGEPAVRARIEDAAARGEKYLVADAIDESQLDTLGAALLGSPLTAGAAGLAEGLASAWVTQAAPPAAGPDSPQGHGAEGPAVVLAGSCSVRTLEQVAVLERSGRPAYRLDVVADRDPVSLAERALAWYDERASRVAPVIYSSAPADELRRIHAEVGVAESARILEDATGRIARGLVERGVRTIVAAGGETSGAIVDALGVPAGVIGEEAAPGVPWIHTVSTTPLSLLLKSGNFGDPELLARASALPVTPKADAVA